MNYARCLLIIVLICQAGGSTAQNTPIAASIDKYLLPYVQSGNFSGDVLVRKSGKILLHKSYGFADRERHLQNTAITRFHIASMSMQFTAAAILRLADRGSLSLDDHVSNFVPGITEGDKITIRDLLIERSGLPDINDFPDYGEIIQHHQTPSSLVTKIEGHPLLFEPGSRFLHEEHSAYNLLALIIEKKTGMPFRTAMDSLVFRPARLSSSGVDDDSMRKKEMAKGYQPDGTYDLKPAPGIHWSAKSGNASVFTTALDESKWVVAFFHGGFLKPATLQSALDTSIPIGYGWFKKQNKRFGKAAFYMNGRAPGFASFVLYLPDDDLTVIILSNIYSSATNNIGYDVAAISLDLPYEPFAIKAPGNDAVELESCAGTFQFGPDFYQKNARVSIVSKGSGLSLRWPSGDISPLIPQGNDRFTDRSYWETVKIERNPSQQPAKLIYGTFEGIVIAREE